MRVDGRTVNSHWKQRPEGGGRFAIGLIRAIACRGGRAIARALLLPITAYFLLVRGPERRASRAYLARVLGRRAGVLDVARHIHAFASTILDRVFLLSGQLERFAIKTEGLDVLHEQLDRGRGVLVFGSHLGSFDALRVLARERPDVQVRIVLDKSHNPAITSSGKAGSMGKNGTPRAAQAWIDASRIEDEDVTAATGRPSTSATSGWAIPAGSASSCPTARCRRARPGRPSRPPRITGSTISGPSWT